MLHQCILIGEKTIEIHHSTDLAFVILHLNAISDGTINVGKYFAFILTKPTYSIPPSLSRI